jgi:hypothetical protein
MESGNTNGNRPRFDGQRIWMNGREWIVPALSMRQYIEHSELLKSTDVTVDNFHEFLTARVPVILAALQRNYPEVTEEQLEEMLDMRTFNLMLHAAQGVAVPA